MQANDTTAEDDVTAILQDQGADRRELGRQLRAERDPLDSKLLGERGLRLEAEAELISVENRPHGTPVRTYRYRCDHEHRTALLTPPKECPTCRTARFEQMKPIEQERRTRYLNAQRAAERAENAHTYRKRHLVCRLCVLSRQVDAYALTEAHAGMFGKSVPHGFKR